MPRFETLAGIPKRGVFTPNPGSGLTVEIFRKLWRYYTFLWRYYPKTWCYYPKTGSVTAPQTRFWANLLADTSRIPQSSKTAYQPYSVIQNGLSALSQEGKKADKPFWMTEVSARRLVLGRFARELAHIFIFARRDTRQCARTQCARRAAPLERSRTSLTNSTSFHLTSWADSRVRSSFAFARGQSSFCFCITAVT